MFQSPATLPQEPSARYTLLRAQLTALMEGVTAPLSNMANMAALLYQSLPELNWAGFYLCKGETLLLGTLPGQTRLRGHPLWKRGLAAQPRPPGRHSWYRMCMPFPAISPVTAPPRRSW